jgi:hypothetical protein
MAMHRARIAWLRGNLPAAIQEARDALEDTKTYGFFVRSQPPHWYQRSSGTTISTRPNTYLPATTCRKERNYLFIWWILAVPASNLALARSDIRRARAELAAGPSEHTSLPLQLAVGEVAIRLSSPMRTTTSTS